MSLFFAILTGMIDVILCNGLFYCVLRRKKIAPWKIISVAAGISVAIAAANLAGVHYNVVFLGYLLLAFVYAMVFYSGSAVIKLFSVFLLAEVILAGDHLGAGITMLLRPGISNQSLYKTEENLMIGSAAVYIYIILMTVMFYAFPIRADRVPLRKSIPLLCVPLSAGIVSFMTNTLWDAMPSVSGWAYLLPFSLFVLLILFALLFCRNMERIEREQREIEMLTSQQEYFEKTYETIIGDLSTMRAFRHDVKNHFSAISGLIAAGDFGEASAYLQDIQPAFIDMQRDKLTPNVVVDMLLRQKKATAEKEGIPFEVNAVVPERIGIPYPDLCVILSNGLDNAIEACLREIDVRKRYIKVSIFLKKPCLFVIIENRVAEKLKVENGRFISTKEGRREHGYGLMNIQKLVEKKYEGAFLPEWHGERFVLNCSLTLPREIWEEREDDREVG